MQALLLDDLRERSEVNANLQDMLKEINNRLSKIEKHAANQPIKADTYASVAKAATKAAHLAHAGDSTKEHTPKALKSARKAKETIFRIEEGVEKSELREVPPKELLERLRRAPGESSNLIASIRWLPSGDLLVYAATKEGNRHHWRGMQC